MNVLFVYPVPPPKYQILRYQQGIGSISAVLKQAGHRTSLLYLWQLDDDSLDRRIREFGPQLVAVSMTSGFFEFGCAVAKQVKERHNLPVLFGGVHPTLRPEESIAADGVFAICVGEGEYPTLELCDAMEAGRDPTKIQNLWVRQNGEVHRNGIRPLITDLDSLPFPDREIFPFDELLKTLPEAEFMGSRGCPYLCTYCVNHALIEMYKGKGAYVRSRSVDNLLDEIDEVTRRYPAIGFLGFHDDTFTLNPRWLKEFSEKYPARFKKYPFWCNATAKSVTEDVVRMLKHAGCYEVRIGLESGNDHIRVEVLRKKLTRDEIIRAFRLLREAGIHTYAFNMIGLPYETVDTIRDTIELNRIVQADEVFCSVFNPYPGTRLDELCRENGWFTGKTVASYFENEYSLNQPSVSRKDVLYYHEIFRDLVRWPWAGGIIRLAHRIPVSRTKTLWNVIRRLRAKGLELLHLMTRKRAPDCAPS
ncbi:MAG: radical SAM protein [Lentisphaerae bacterium]|nr:radical SAM protein [Lentisphaerota bacterium]